MNNPSCGPVIFPFTDIEDLAKLGRTNCKACFWIGISLEAVQPAFEAGCYAIVSDLD